MSVGPSGGTVADPPASAPVAGGSVAGTGITTAVLLATAPADDGGPAAGLAWEDGTVLGRLLGQLGDIGLRSVHVITRPGWVAGLEATAAGARMSVSVAASPDVAGDLRAVAGLCESGAGGLIVAYADIVTHREALAGVLADPRVATGILYGGRRRPLAFRVRTARGRVVSGASPYHAAHRPNGTFLGVLKVSARDRPELLAAAERLEELVSAGISELWEAELQRKAEGWRARHDEQAESAADAALEDGLEPQSPPDPEDEGPDQALAGVDEDEVHRRLAVVREDALAMLLVGLVRADVHLTASHVRKLFWARPFSPEAVAQAAEDLKGYDEDKVLLDSAVKARDGFFTTFFVSPYSKYVARWAARRGLTPNQITTVSLGIGILAAAGFATGERWGMVAGAILLQLAFTTDCVDGQLARYTRQFSKLGAWLDSIFDRSKEYVVFAGLAIGASAQGDPVWALAAAALTLQITRHLFDFSFAAGQHQAIASIQHPPLTEPLDAAHKAAARAAAAEAAANGAPPPPPDAPAPADQPPVRKPLTLRTLPGRALSFWRRFDRLPAVAWIKRMIAFPIGERFAAISIFAALTTPRTTFTVLLVWGGIAAIYTMGGRFLRSLLPSAAARLGQREQGRTTLEIYRDDGPLAQAIATLGRAVPVPGALLAALAALPVFAVLALEGDGASEGLAAAVVGWFVLVGGLSRGRPQTRRIGWTPPPLIRAAEYAGIAWLAAIGGALPAGFALIGVLAFRHYDLVYRLRHRATTPPAWLDALALGWDGRLILALVLLVAGALPAGLYALAGLYAVVFTVETVAGWIAFNREHRSSLVGSYDEEEDEGQ